MFPYFFRQSTFHLPLGADGARTRILSNWTPRFYTVNSAYKIFYCNLAIVCTLQWLYFFSIFCIQQADNVDMWTCERSDMKWLIPATGSSKINFVVMRSYRYVVLTGLFRFTWWSRAHRKLAQVNVIYMSDALYEYFGTYNNNHSSLIDWSV